MRDDAAPCQHTLNELLDQHLVVDGRVIGSPVCDLDDVHGIAHALAPARNGEERRIYQAAHEGISVSQETVRGLDDTLQIEGPPPEEVPVIDPVRRGAEVGRDFSLQSVPGVRQDVPVHEEPGAFPGLHESILLQRLVGKRYGRHAHLELRRQLTNGREGPVQRVLPVDDTHCDLAPDLFLQALRTAAVYGDHVLIHRGASDPRCGAGSVAAMAVEPRLRVRPGLEATGGRGPNRFVGAI